MIEEHKDIGEGDAPAPQSVAAAQALAAPEPCRDGNFSSAGWQGLFKVSTRLVGDKEIDVDDREANLLFTLEMKATEPWEFRLENVHVVLKLNPAGRNQNIAIDGQTEGDLVLFDAQAGHRLFPGVVLSRQLKITTGAFSSRQFRAEPAEPGLKQYEVEIEYDLVPAVGDSASTTQAQLLFYVADD